MPTTIELIAAVPITLSFVGAALLEGAPRTSRSSAGREAARRENEDTESLLGSEEESDNG